MVRKGMMRHVGASTFDQVTLKRESKTFLSLQAFGLPGFQAFYTMPFTFIL